MQSPPETVANRATDEKSAGTVGQFVALLPARMLAVARVTAITAGYPPTQQWTEYLLSKGSSLPGF